jgi:hypothetical protein
MGSPGANDLWTTENTNLEHAFVFYIYIYIHIYTHTYKILVLKAV